MMKKFVGLGGAMLLAGAVLGSVSPVLAEEAGKAITIAPPPAGMGQVVFFRTGAAASRWGAK